MPARQRAQQPNEWSGSAAGNPGGEAGQSRRGELRSICVRRSKSPIRVAGTNGTKNPSLPGGGEGLSFDLTVAGPFRPSRKLSLSRWQVGLLARGFKRSDSTFGATLSLPRTRVRVAHSRLLPTYSGGTAPASHRTSLLCPKGHLQRAKQRPTFTAASTLVAYTLGSVAVNSWTATVPALRCRTTRRIGPECPVT